MKEEAPRFKTRPSGSLYALFSTKLYQSKLSTTFHCHWYSFAIFRSLITQKEEEIQESTKVNSNVQ